MTLGINTRRDKDVKKERTGKPQELNTQSEGRAERTRQEVQSDRDGQIHNDRQEARTDELPKTTGERECGEYSPDVNVPAINHVAA